MGLGEGLVGSGNTLDCCGKETEIQLHAGGNEELCMRSDMTIIFDITLASIWRIWKHL